MTSTPAPAATVKDAWNPSTSWVVACRGRARAHAHALLIMMLLSISGCGSRSTAPPDTLPPEQVAAADTAVCDLIRRRTDALAEQLDRALPGNVVRERTIRMRLRVAEIIMRAKQEQNQVVRLGQLWFWTIAFCQHFTQNSATHFHGQEETIAHATADLLAGVETLVHKVIPDPGYATLRANLQEAAKRGDAFYALQPDQGSTVDQVLSMGGLQSLLSLPLAPFNALNGIGEGAKGLEHLSIIGERLITLLMEYPQMMQLQCQLLAVQLQDQDAARTLIADVDRITKASEDAIHVLPTELRRQLEILVQETAPQQQSMRDLLERATVMADSMRSLIESSQKLLVEVKPLLPSQERRPASGEPAGKPMDLHELAESLMALQSATKELRGLVTDTASTLTSTHLDERAHAADAALHNHIDLITYRIIEILVVAAILATYLLVLSRRLRPPADHRAPPSSSASGPA